MKGPKFKDRDKASSQVECRCEESKRKSLLEIIKTILKDLRFWRKA